MCKKVDISPFARYIEFYMKRTINKTERDRWAGENVNDINTSSHVRNK
jgi:hypothetical protein